MGDLKGKCAGLQGVNPRLTARQRSTQSWLVPPCSLHRVRCLLMTGQSGRRTECLSNRRDALLTVAHGQRLHRSATADVPLMLPNQSYVAARLISLYLHC